MNDEQDRLMDLFNEAHAKGSAAERNAYLDAACGGNDALRRQVEALLQAHTRLGDFLKPPADDALPSERPGTVVGRYKLLEQIGEGGFGVVFMAEQREPIRRKVAFKVIKPGMDTKQVIARFEAERQALALLDHPNIARIFDAGATETGRPYFVMELVHGVPITDFCDANDLTPPERLQLFLTVCEAVQHAHQKGIIHRDLKPSNILVTLHDGKPVPKVIDFGTAKALQAPLTEKTLFTAYGKLLGTPQYMSPEQAELSGLDVDTRADIYSLGVLLYELLTGTTPFEGERLRAAAFEEMMRIIRQEEPPKPSTRVSTLGERVVEIAKHRQADAGLLRRTLQGDLDWIVMKALEKDRARRYDTASTLAEDLQHHLNHEPVKAGPPGAVYRTRKFVRRHRMGVALAASVTVVLVAGLVASLIGFREARLERDHAIHAEREAQQERDRAVAAEQLAESNEKKARTEAVRSAQVARFLQDMLAGVGPAVARGRDTMMLREILDQTAERVGKDLSDQPEVQAELQYTMGRVYDALGVFDRSGALHREALATRRELRGNENADVAASLYGLAEVIENNGRPGEAEPLYREALAIRLKVLGNEHVDVATSLRGLASALSGQDRLQESESLFREALAMRQKLLGDEHPDAASSLQELAYVLGRQDKLAEAERLGHEALAMHRKLFVTDHPKLAQCVSAQAQILMWNRKWAEAEALLREVWEIRGRLLGKDHDKTLRMLSRLGVTLFNQGKLAEAGATCREVLGTKEVDMNKPSWGGGAVSESGKVLFRALMLQGRLAEAKSVGRELAEKKGHSSFLNQLAWLLATCPEPTIRDGQSAVGYAEKAVAITSRTNSTALATLAAAYAEAGQFTNAVNVQKEAMALLKSEEERKDHESRLRVYESGIPYRDHELLVDQSRVLLREGKLDEAEACLTEAISDWRAHYGNEHPAVARALCELGNLRNRQNRPADAEKLFREAWGIYRKTGFPHASLAAQFPVVIAGTLREQLKFTEAAALMREEMEQGNVNAVNAVAWLLATSPDAQARDGASAVGFAQRAVTATSRTNTAFLDTLAAAHAEAGQFPEAIRLQREAIALVENEEEKLDFESRLRLFQAGHPFREYEDMLRVLHRLGRLAEAESLQREQLAMHRLMFELGAPALAAPLVELTLTLLGQEKFAEAERCARECLAICEKKQPPDWNLFEARSLLGDSLLGQKKYAEAEPLLLSGYEGMKQRENRIPVPGRPRLEETLRRLVQLYDATDHPEQAAKWKHKLAEFEKPRTDQKPAAPAR